MTESLKLALKAMLPDVADQHLELLVLCLSRDTKKPLFDISTFSDGPLGEAFK